MCFFFKVNQTNVIKNDTKILLTKPSKDRFEAKLTSFSQNVIDRFKKIAGYKYNPDLKTWSFPIGQKKNFMSKMTDMSVENA